jgi:hypothetical protein
VLGRRPGYNPKQNAILGLSLAARAQLSEYYPGEGVLDPVVIELHKPYNLAPARWTLEPQPKVIIQYMLANA